MTRQNPILAKKQGSKFYKCNFSTLRATLIVGQNPFIQRKNLPNTANSAVPKRRNGQKIDALVTTSHVLWPNQPRKAALLLPNWLRNFDFPSAERQPGGGGSAARIPQKASIQMRTQNFLPNEFPTLFCGCKKRRQAPTPVAGCEDAHGNSPSHG